MLRIFYGLGHSRNSGTGGSSVLQDQPPQPRTTGRENCHTPLLVATICLDPASYTRYRHPATAFAQ